MRYANELYSSSMYIVYGSVAWNRNANDEFLANQPIQPDWWMERFKFGNWKLRKWKRKRTGKKYTHTHSHTHAHKSCHHHHCITYKMETRQEATFKFISTVDGHKLCDFTIEIAFYALDAKNLCEKRKRFWIWMHINSYTMYIIFLYVLGKTDRLYFTHAKKWHRTVAKVSFQILMGPIFISFYTLKWIRWR